MAGELSIVSFNLHGFNQGQVAVNELIETHDPDIFILQEHWLTPANLSRFDIWRNSHFSFGCSAMSRSLETGMLRGRPYGGVMTLIRNSLRSNTEAVFSSERYSVVRVGNLLLFNVYLPCSGSTNRLLICQDVLIDIWSWRENFPGCECIIAGDLNVDLINGNDDICRYINSFCDEHCLISCDSLNLPFGPRVATYVNLALQQQSTIDYILVSKPHLVNCFQVIEPDINFSDHLPLFARVSVEFSCNNASLHSSRQSSSSSSPSVLQLRWDRADLVSYYQYTGCHLQPVSIFVDELLASYNENQAIDYCSSICNVHDAIVNVLDSASQQFVPRYRKNFFKYWWDQELRILKEQSIESNRIWKDMGKPRSGPIFDKRQSARLQYRKKIRETENSSLCTYTNDLHEALLVKDGIRFWNSWRCKFESSTLCSQVEGCVDKLVIANKFAEHFESSYSCNSVDRSATLESEYELLRSNYCGLPLTSNYMFDTETVSCVVNNLKSGRAAGLDGLSAEHFQKSHPILSCILAKLFNLMLCCGYVPDSFGLSYTVPLPKPKDYRTRAMQCDDFRGIAISTALSKIFEHCVVQRFGILLNTSDAQFGFKKGLSCRHAIYTARCIVNNLLKGGSTVNLCAIDLRKAFDKTNHYALFIKLMSKLVPVELLSVIECWLSKCFSCVKWDGVYSPFFKMNFGVRQGSVLSPFLFAVYVDELASLFNVYNNCYIILYADDILLITSSVCALQDLLNRCESILSNLDMTINAKKSCSLRIGPRCNVTCASIVCGDGQVIPWAAELRYLGVFVLRARTFSCSLEYSKRAFYRAANAIYGKVGCVASEEVTLQLVYSKCLPVLLYGLEACQLRKADRNCLDFTWNRFLMKLFRTGSIDVINDCRLYFGIPLPSTLIDRRSAAFINQYSFTDNSICRLVSHGNY